jgi:hypothetical protein
MRRVTRAFQVEYKNAGKRNRRHDGYALRVDVGALRFNRVEPQIDENRRPSRGFSTEPASN